MQSRAILLALIILGISSGGVSGAGTEKRDGFWWRDLSQERKVFYILGYTDAFSDAYHLISESDLPNQQQKLVHNMFDFYKIQMGQFVEGLDSFYSDYRNQKTPMTSAIFFVRDEIRGEPRNKQDETLRKLREIFSH
jgi:hypothetical protein